MDTQNGTIGGGEILKYWNQDYNTSSPYFNNELIKQYYLVPIIKTVIIVLIIGLMIYFLLKLFGIKEIKRGRGISNELEYMQTVRKHDNRVLMYNKLINSITRFI